MALNGALARTVCRFLELPFEARALLSSGVFQVILSVVWTTAALVTMLVATRARRRHAWQVGAALLVVTVIKLLLFDLADTGTLTRIVSLHCRGRSHPRRRLLLTVAAQRRRIEERLRS